MIKQILADAPPIRPLDDRVVVKPTEPVKKSEGGILLPDSAQEKSYKGIVVRVGPGALDRKTGQRDMGNLKPGDLILFGKYTGHEVPGYPGYHIMRFSDVLCTVED